MTNPAKNSIIKFANGDQINLKDFFYSFYPELISFARKYLPINISEDIVQDVFIVFWEKKKTFLNLYALKSFFYISARNACLDYLKHDKVAKKYMEYRQNKNDFSESFLDEVLKVEAYNEIYQEINKLPEMGKKVLLLALKEKSNEEIAKHLNIAINTVRTHKARAYKVLRQNLGDIFLFLFPYKTKSILAD